MIRKATAATASKAVTNGMDMPNWCDSEVISVENSKADGSDEAGMDETEKVGKIGSEELSNELTISEDDSGDTDFCDEVSEEAAEAEGSDGLDETVWEEETGSGKLA